MSLQKCYNFHNCGSRLQHTGQLSIHHTLNTISCKNHSTRCWNEQCSSLFDL